MRDRPLKVILVMITVRSFIINSVKCNRIAVPVYCKVAIGPVVMVFNIIGHIHKKLGDDSFIATIRGVGYRFEDEME